ncbi:MAG: hypothetical protein WCB27_18405 [Thermoguttaceae bacterium]
MSPRKSSNTLESPQPAAPRFHRKPQADLYTILLAMALVAVLVAILFLYLFLRLYAQPGAPPMPMASVWTHAEREMARAGDKEISSFISLSVSPSPRRAVLGG